VLLIEFDESIPFHLQDFGKRGGTELKLGQDISS